MSALEEELALQLKAAGIPFQREVRFAAPRRWRADFLAWSGGITIGDRLRAAPDGSSYEWERIASGVYVEVQGVGPQGRHGSWNHIESDCEKFSTAAAIGYRVLPVTGKMVRDGRALALIEVALGLKGPGTLQVAAATRSARKASRPARRTPRASKLPERVRKAAGLP